jgi:DNA-binding NarL/FixJ family response regulator
VLLVDDDPEFRRLARCLLRGDAVAVVGEAASVATAIAAAHELRPEAVLVDVCLPDGSGIDLARALSALPWRPRVVLTSTDPHAAGAEDVRSSGALGFIAKRELPDGQLERTLAEP